MNCVSKTRKARPIHHKETRMNTDRKHWAALALTASLSCGAYAQDLSLIHI